jgi:hypothetical protein
VKKDLKKYFFKFVSKYLSHLPTVKNQDTGIERKQENVLTLPCAQNHLLVASQPGHFHTQGPCKRN